MAQVRKGSKKFLSDIVTVIHKWCKNALFQYGLLCHVKGKVRRAVKRGVKSEATWTGGRFHLHLFNLTYIRSCVLHFFLDLGQVLNYSC